MDLEAVLHQLEEAKELEDWDMIEESIELIRAIIDDYDEYNETYEDTIKNTDKISKYCDFFMTNHFKIRI